MNEPTARVEAAAKAAHGHDYRHATYAVKWEDATEAMRADYRECETAALAAADAVMFDGAAVERVAEAMWLHRPMERVYDEGPNMGEAKPWKYLKPYQHDRYRGWAAAVLAALIEGDDK